MGGTEATHGLDPVLTVDAAQLALELGEHGRGAQLRVEVQDHPHEVTGDEGALVACRVYVVQAYALGDVVDGQVAGLVVGLAGDTSGVDMLEHGAVLSRE